MGSGFFYFLFFFYNFTKEYRIIRHFEIKVLNQQTSQTGVSKFSNVLLKGTPLRFPVKFCKKFLKYLCVYFFKKKFKNFKDSNMGIFANSDQYLDSSIFFSF
jgi:hypothetical protein